MLTWEDRQEWRIRVSKATHPLAYAPCQFVRDCETHKNIMLLTEHIPKLCQLYFGQKQIYCRADVDTLFNTPTTARQG